MNTMWLLEVRASHVSLSSIKKEKVFHFILLKARAHRAGVPSAVPRNLFSRAEPADFVTLTNDLCNSRLISPHFQPLKSPIHYRDDSGRATEQLSAERETVLRSHRLNAFSGQYVHQSVLEQDTRVLSLLCSAFLFDNHIHWCSRNSGSLHFDFDVFFACRWGRGAAARAGRQRDPGGPEAQQRDHLAGPERERRTPAPTGDEDQDEDQQGGGGEACAAQTGEAEQSVSSVEINKFKLWNQTKDVEEVVSCAVITHVVSLFTFLPVWRRWLTLWVTI